MYGWCYHHKDPCTNELAAAGLSFVVSAVDDYLHLSLPPSVCLLLRLTVGAKGGCCIASGCIVGSPYEAVAMLLTPPVGMHGSLSAVSDMIRSSLCLLLL